MNYPFSGIIVRYVGRAIDTTETPSDELHVNLWEVIGRRFIDIGVMVTNPSEASAVQVDLPWISEKSKIFDLGSRLVGEKIVAAIFNEVVRYSGSNDEKFAHVFFPSSTYQPFVLARLNFNDFTLQQAVLSNGAVTTKLTISLPPIPPPFLGNRMYIRFRILDIPENVYTAKFFQRDRNLLSSSVEMRIVDFRINVRRGVPDDVLSSQSTLFFPRWKKIHFFLTLDRAREMTFNSENFVACRSLEDEAIWNSYIALGSEGSTPERSISDYLGYQWTAKAKKAISPSTEGTPAKDLVALARFSQVTSSGWYMFRFMVLALVVGAAGNGIWEILGSGVINAGTKLGFLNWNNYKVLIGLGVLSVIIMMTVFITPVSARTFAFVLARRLKKFFGWIGALFRQA